MRRIDKIWNHSTRLGAELATKRKWDDSDGRPKDGDKGKESATNPPSKAVTYSLWTRLIQREKASKALTRKAFGESTISLYCQTMPN